MEFIKNINVALIAPFFAGIFLVSSVPANADWIQNGMRLASVPDFNQGQSAEPYIPPVVNPPVRHDQPTEHHQELKHKPTSIDPRHHRQEHDNFIYVDLSPVIDVNPVVVVNPVVNLNPVADDSPDEDASPADDTSSVLNVSPAFAVPDGFDMVVVEDHTYFYSKGVFYQLNGNQLTAISPGPDQE